ncbi:MAG: hypothetical protein KC668_07990 [Myxococcales bacterium]|nr:hypothetical protein [Myxococcales bacterium]
MHGLRCSPEIPGFTRLLDEWVVGLTRYHDDAAGVFADDALFERSFAEAATRVRAFAWGAGEVQPTEVVDQRASFELQGYDYSVAVHRLEVSSAEQLAAQAEASMCAAAEAAPAVDEHLRVGVVLVSVRAPEQADEATRLALAHRYRDETRQLGSTGAAWSFPSADEGPAYAYCGDGMLGGILLARRLPG